MNESIDRRYVLSFGEICDVNGKLTLIEIDTREFSPGPFKDIFLGMMTTCFYDIRENAAKEFDKNSVKIGEE